MQTLLNEIVGSDEYIGEQTHNCSSTERLGKIKTSAVNSLCSFINALPRGLSSVDGAKIAKAIRVSTCFTTEHKQTLSD